MRAPHRAIRCITDFGPFIANFDLIPYNDIEALEAELSYKDPDNILGLCWSPSKAKRELSFLTKVTWPVRELCTKYNVLMIAGEFRQDCAGQGKC